MTEGLSAVYVPDVDCVGAPRSRSIDDDVVLLGPAGDRIGTIPKRDVHGPDTPLHLAISCYVVRADGKILLTRRAAAKRTWPGTWTNACCGHPRPDETLLEAVHRHLYDEIGLRAVRLRLALPDFTYRAEMADGCVEHELCPVFVAEVEGMPVLDPDEADALEWLSWTALVERARSRPHALSPWSVTQIGRLTALFTDPLDWVRSGPGAVPTQPTAPVLASADPFARMGDRVDRVVEAFMARADAELMALDPLAAELATPIRSLYRAGGKRLRPLLVHCGYMAACPDALGGDDAAHDALADVDVAAAAVEMLHTFALVHDDVMDRSHLRRGQPTTHLHFADVHAASSAGGDADWFGASAAIVAGDLAFVWADELLDELRCRPSVVRRARTVFNELRREVIAGQYLDLRLAGPCATDQQALSVALLKSARYTVTRPLQLGAILGEADADTIAALTAYGDAIGVAFQLRDDVLGVFGDPDVMGKGACDDVRSGKSSLLLVRALELASPTGRAVLRRCLGQQHVEDDDVHRCREAVLASGALASIEALIAAKLDEAERALAELHPAAGADLAALARLLAHRTA